MALSHNDFSLRFFLIHSPSLSRMASKLTHTKRHLFIFGHIWSYKFLKKIEGKNSYVAFERILIEMLTYAFSQLKYMMKSQYCCGCYCY